MAIATARLAAASAALLAISGCATYQSQQPQLVYYAVPCNTPGAFKAQLSSATAQLAANASRGTSSTAVEAQANAASSPTCLVAAQLDDRSYARNYGNYGSYYGYAGGYGPYYGYGGFGHPFYGSVAIFGHGGGHGGFNDGGHSFGGGHAGGGHGGGHGRH